VVNETCQGPASLSSSHVRIYVGDGDISPFDFNAVLYQFPCTVVTNDSFTITWAAVGAAVSEYLIYFQFYSLSLFHFSLKFYSSVQFEFVTLNGQIGVYVAAFNPIEAFIDFDAPGTVSGMNSSDIAFVLYSTLYR
jgi:hypothetical protein